MATPDTRAAYTALSNTIIGVVLILGAALGLVAQMFGSFSVILLLAIFSGCAILTALGLEDVQERQA